MKRGLAYLVLGLASALAVAPFAVTVLAAFKTDVELVQGVFSLPRTWQWQNFATAWTQGEFSRFFVNSVLVAVGTVVPTVALSCLTGYAFARMRFSGRKWLFPLLMLGFVVPLQALIIPLYHLLNWLGLLNTLWALILPQVALSLSFGTYLLASAFRNVPSAILDAAAIDGCTTGQLLWRIMVPLCRPIIGTLALLIFVWTWNEFLLPFVVTVESAAQTLPVGLLHFQQRWTSQIPIIAAGSTIVFMPLILVFSLFQRQLIRGLLSGAVKE